MDVRLALYALAERHGLAPAATARLLQHAALDAPPENIAPLAWRGVALVGAALGGLGVILWLAANWDDFGRIGRFALLQGLVLAACAGAAWHAAARKPLLLLALLGIGGLFAYVGQTYQTGADPWTLFALWAVLALPLCLAARSDVLWTPWALVAATAIGLWVHTLLGHRWRAHPDDLPVHGLGWALLALLVAALSRPLARYTGAGPWSLRTAVTLTVAAVSATAIGALFFAKLPPHYVLALALSATAALALAQRRFFEIYALSAVMLGLNTLVVGGLARWLFEGVRGDPVGAMLLLGLVAAGLLAASVHWILRLARRTQKVAE